MDRRGRPVRAFFSPRPFRERGRAHFSPLPPGEGQGVRAVRCSRGFRISQQEGQGTFLPSASGRGAGGEGSSLLSRISDFGFPATWGDCERIYSIFLAKASKSLDYSVDPC